MNFDKNFFPYLLNNLADTKKSRSLDGGETKVLVCDIVESKF